MLTVDARYQPPFWLRGRHLQTIYPAAWMPLPTVAYSRERWDTPDGDFIELDWLNGDSQQPLVVLFHGLEGNSRSHYALRLMSALQAKNWRGVVIHFRGCGGTPNRMPRGYHCGDSAEIDWILRRLRQQTTSSVNCSATIYAVGVSLGSNALLKWLGEQRDEARQIIDKAVAISAPLALPTTGHVLGSGFNKLYARLFLKTLRPKALAMIEQHRLDFDVDAIRTVDNLWQFDGLFTAPLHGFKDADDYWEEANSRPYLKTIKLATLLINACNDPFLPARDLPGEAEVSSYITCDFQAEGGHVGFAGQQTASGKDWLTERILCFLESHF